jgi:cytoskeletal protein RodZ
MKRSYLLSTLALTLAMSGCWPAGKKTKPLPVPAPPSQAAAPAEQPKSETAQPAKAQPQDQSQIGNAPAESAAPAPRKPRKPATQPAQAPAQAPAQSAAPQPATPVPQLGVMMPPAERKQYEAEYARGLANAQDGLVEAAGHKLTGVQNETVTRIRGFMRQAQELHDRDLSTAAQLARRAALLAQDLLKSLQ